MSEHNAWRAIHTAPWGRRVIIGYCDDHPLGWHVKVGTLEIGDDGVPYWNVEDGEDHHDPEPNGSKYAPRWWMPLPRTPDAPQ
jgi:hypothetical protein